MAVSLGSQPASKVPALANVGLRGEVSGHLDVALCKAQGYFWEFLAWPHIPGLIMTLGTLR